MTFSLTDAAPRPLWWDLHDTAAVSAPLTGVDSADLVIVGAGLTGLWAAIEATAELSSGDIVLLDAGTVGTGASGRNGGFISDSLTHGLAHGQHLWADELTTLVELGRRNLDETAAFLAREGIDADLRRCGKTVLATRTHEVATLRSLRELHVRFGDEAHFQDRDEVRADVDSPTYLAGLRITSGGGLVDPLALTLGLRDAALARGVRLHEGSEVVRVSIDGAGVRVDTPRGRIHARQVLLATNAYRPLLRRLRLLAVPVWDHVIATEPLSAAQLAALGWRDAQGLTDAGNQFHYYRRTRDDRIVFGGYDANYYFGSKREPTLEQSRSHDLLAGHLQRTFPQLGGVAITHRWGGMIDTSSRFTVSVGTALRGRLAYVLGFTGLGVGASRFGALTALDRLAGRSTERTRLAMMRRPPVPFPPEPIRWLGVQATRAAMVREDRTGRRGALLRALDTLGIGFDS